MPKLDLLFYHQMDGEVREYNPRTNKHVRIFQTNEYTEEDLIAPGCTIKLDRQGNDLLVLCSTNKIIALMNVKPNGFESTVSVNGLADHRFTDFQPINKDMIVSLSNTGMITVHAYCSDSSQILHYVLLHEVARNNDICSVVFGVCAQSRYAAVATYHKTDITRDRLYYISLVDNYKPELLDVLDFSADPDVLNRDDGPIITNINMDYYLGDHPLVICSEIENQQRMQVYQYTDALRVEQARTQDGSVIVSNAPTMREKPRLRKIFEKENNCMGLNCKRIGKNLHSIDESGNLIVQAVTETSPEPLRESRMTDSKFIQRSTVLGFPVSAGVTPSRVIPSMEGRPQRYLKNPPATVMSISKVQPQEVGRTSSPGTYMKHYHKSAIPQSSNSKLIELQRVQTKEFSLDDPKKISGSGNNRSISPILQNISQQPKSEIIDGVEYTVEVTTSPKGTRRIIKRPVVKKQDIDIKPPTTVQTVIRNSQPTLIPQTTKVTTISHSPLNENKMIPSVTKLTTIEHQQVKNGEPTATKVVARVKLPDGRTVDKDSPEAQEFF